MLLNDQQKAVLVDYANGKYSSYVTFTQITFDMIDRDPVLWFLLSALSGGSSDTNPQADIQDLIVANTALTKVRAAIAARRTR